MMKYEIIEFNAKNTHALLTQLQGVGNSDIDVDDLPEESIDDLLSLSVDIVQTGLSLDQYTDLFNNCQTMYDDIDEALESGNVDEANTMVFKNRIS